MSISETMRRIEFLLEKHCPRHRSAISLESNHRLCTEYRTRRPLTPSKKRKALRLRSEGYSYEKIADAIDVSEATLYRALTGYKR
jgi:transposase-like protein